MDKRKISVACILFGTCLLVVLTGAGTALHSQSTTLGQFFGAVTDSSGGFAPNADVTVTNKETGVARKTVTNERGEYLVDRMIPGLYEVSVELAGFKKELAAGVRLEGGQKARVDFILQAGAITETITVTGQSTVIDTATAEIAATVDQKQIVDLPLSGRNVIVLSNLTTGASNVRFATDFRLERDGGGVPALNGVMPSSSQILYDGAQNQSIIEQKAAVKPIPETVQEFKIITSNYSAEYGRVGGGIVSMVSKSGTNEFHGSAWEYARNEALDASNFFANKFGQGKLPINQHTFGGALGGPIRKNKTFVFGSYERFTNDSAVPGFMTVPTAAELQGDFSRADGPFGFVPIYDPFNVVSSQRAAFPGNRIVESRWNPISRKVLQQLPYPAPNQATYPNFTFPNTINERKNKYSARVDHHFSGSSTLFGRFTYQDAPLLTHGGTSGGGIGFVGSGSVGLPGMLYGVYQSKFDIERGLQTGVGWVKPFGSKLITEFNASGWWGNQHWESTPSTTNWVKELGYDIADNVQMIAPDGSRGPGGLPTISINGYAGYAGQGDTILRDWGLNFKETVSWNKGRHYLKFGFEHLRNFAVTNRWVPEGSASHDFQGYLTGQIINGQAVPGQPFADFLLGTADSANGNILGGGGFGTGGIGQFNQSTYALFANDDWKVTENVTLNLGLRWEIPLPAVFAFDRANCYIDVAAGRNDPVQVVPQDFPIDSDFVSGGDPSNLVIPFRERDTRRCQPSHYLNLAPRFGLAWRLFGTNRTVLRLGAGLSYDQDYGNWKAATGYLGPFAGKVSEVQVREAAPRIFIGQLLNLPTTAERQLHVTDYFYSPTFQEGQIYSYSLSVEHEILRNTKAEAAYVGNQGRHMLNRRPWNVSLPAGYTIPLVTGERIIASGTREERRPYPKIAPNLMTVSDGNSYYNSLQAKLERRFQDGIGVTMGYTWSRVFTLNFPGAYFDTIPNEFDRKPLKGPALWDRQHSFYSSAVWELPFFKSARPLTRNILGGWELAGILTLASGSPYGVVVSRDLYDLGPRRKILPDRISHGELSSDQRTVDRYYDTDAFVVPTGGSLGNAAIHPLTGPGISMLDFSLYKGFAVAEGKLLQFRLDAFNAFNHPVFYAPGGSRGDNIDTASKGKVLQAATARQLQLGLRFTF